MTISSTLTRVSFLTDGTTTVFPVNIQAYQNTDFEAILTTAAGVSTTLTLNSDYSLVSSGSLTPPYWTLTCTDSSPWVAGQTLQVILNPAQVQDTVYNQGSAFPSSALQENVDRLTQMVLRLQDQVNRSLRAPDGDNTPQMVLPDVAQRANLVLGFNSAGLPEAVNAGGVGPAGANAIVLSVTNPACVVPANSSGVVSSFATAVGQCNLYSGTTNVTAQAAWSIYSLNNCVCAVNAVVGVPNSGPIGYYAFTSLTGLSGSATIQAIYGGVTYTITVSIAAALAGATGPQGATGTPGSGTSAVSFTLQNPVLAIVGYANYTYPSSALPLGGQGYVYSGNTLVNSSCTWAATATNCTGTVNTAANTPVSGEPIGYYQITALSAASGSLTITATYMGTVFTATFTVNVVPAGYQIVSSTSAITSPFEGQIVYDSTDGQLYRYHSGAWTTAVPAVNITGTITGTQIANGTITTANLAANSVTASQIAANTITAGQIAANTLTSSQIQAGSITAASLGVTSLSAISANVGTLNAGILQNSGGSAIFNLNSGYIEFNNGSYMKVSGVGFGAGSNYLEWYGPTVSSASNFAACTDANAIYYLKTNGQAYFAGQVNPIIVRNLSGTGTEYVPYGCTYVTAVLIGAGGGGASSNSGSRPTGGGGGGGFCQSTFSVTPGQSMTYSVGGGGVGGQYLSGTNVYPGSGGGATTLVTTGVSMSAGGGGGGGNNVGGSAGTASGATVNANGNAGTSGTPGSGGASGATGWYGLGNGGNGDVSGSTGQTGNPGYLYLAYG